MEHFPHRSSLRSGSSSRATNHSISVSRETIYSPSESSDSIRSSFRSLSERTGAPIGLLRNTHKPTSQSTYLSESNLRAKTPTPRKKSTGFTELESVDALSRELEVLRIARERMGHKNKIDRGDSEDMILDVFGNKVDQYYKLTGTRTSSPQPELPEVERARRWLHTLCVNHTIRHITTHPDPLVFHGTTTPESFTSKLLGRTITNTLRKGKWFGLETDSGDTMIAHFGMTGTLVGRGTEDSSPFVYGTQKDTNPQDFPPRFCKFVIELDNGTAFAFADARRLARIRLIHGDAFTSPPLSQLGFDALTDMIPINEFTALFSNRSKPIKSLILDQSFISGIENLYADEILFQAKLHPSQLSQTLTPTDLKSLHTAITSVLQTACSVNADSSHFPSSWLFHHRYAGKRLQKNAPKMPDGSAIEFDTHAGRTSAFVPSVQVLRGQVGVRRGAGKKGKKKRAKSEDFKEEEVNDEEQEPVAVTAKLRNTRSGRAF
ncbi:hypothetical protein HDU98_002691 [Podochytrium sp. JEL0797]|nr:hypothetical protein HDU98_002691 [Podochytrium sp. JEL0797]